MYKASDSVCTDRSNTAWTVLTLEKNEYREWWERRCVCGGAGGAGGGVGRGEVISRKTNKQTE